MSTAGGGAAAIAPAPALLGVESLSTVLAAGDELVRAVDGVTFSVRRGETFALLGESGCGKSTTALSIVRLLPDAGTVVAGSVWLGSEDLLELPEIRMRAVRGLRIGMIFQEPALALNPVMPIGAQIAESLRLHRGLDAGAARAEVLRWLAAVGIPDPERRYGEYPFQLSGGMKQRAMIAMALACEPDLLIADEPTTALDVTIQAQVLDLLRELQQRTGMAVLLITHDLAVVAEVADRVAVMYAGEIVELAPAAACFARPAHPYTRKLFASLPGAHRRGARLDVIPGSVPSLAGRFTGCRFAERCDQVEPRCRSAPPPLLPSGPGHEVRCVFGDRPAPAGDGASGTAQAALAAPAQPAYRVAPGAAPLLSVEELRVHFPIHRGVLRRVVGHVKAVDGVSFSIAAGRTLALVGESGCGKTTAGKAILHLIEPSAGRIVFAGTDLGALGARALRAERRRFQIVFQDPYSSLNPRMRIADILEEGLAAQGVGRDRADRHARIDRLLEQVGLGSGVRYRYPHEFSGGQRQRIAIARALSVEPQLIVCDEPTSSLDVSVQAQILNLLKDLQDRLGVSYLFITHNLAVVDFLAHEVAVMYLGRIVEHGSVDQVLRTPAHPYTQALLSAVPSIERAGAREAAGGAGPTRLHLGGDPPSPVAPPAGCHFHPRCPSVREECRSVWPAERRIADGQRVSCHLHRGAG
jgi:peptide/nickel transport system ATP-binding protein